MILLAIYIITYIISLRPIFRFFMADIGVPDTAGELFIDLLLTAIYALGAPCFIVWRGFEWALSGGSRDPEVIARKLAGESRQEKVKRLELERAKREEYINSLERELEIGDYASPTVG